MSNFIFATSSPRRINILENINVEFKFISHEFDENNDLNMKPKDLVVLNAENKSKSISKDFPKDTIFASDTIVYKNEIIGKPKNKIDAIRIINKLNNDFHTVLSSIVVLKNKKILFSGVKSSLVRTNNISTDKIKKYIDSGYYIDKAGGYGIQNKKFDFVNEYYGCYENILGLPTCLIKEYFSIIKLKNDYSFSHC